MASTCVVGLQWGDEAKGKFVDMLAERHDIVVRYNGGANAGHTIVVGEEVYKLSLIPSGIVRPGIVCVIGNGVVIEPAALLRELDELTERGIDVSNRLWISDRAHVVAPYHLHEEQAVEESDDGQAIGTTRRGIGPCYADKVGRRCAIRIGDLLDPQALRARLETIVPFKNRLLRSLGSDSPELDVAQLAAEFETYGARMRPYVRDTFWFLQGEVRHGKRLLFEGAQGTLLDIDHGSFPYVTSSNSSASGLWSGSGVPARKVDDLVGVAKAYTTRVGAGPFPTELHDEIGATIRKEGNEFGTVTGRPRRCGWFDAVAARYTTMLNGIDQVAVTLLDVLGKLDEIKICEAYRIDGERTDEFAVGIDRLARCEPVYRTLSGWNRDISGCRRPADLPREARVYLDTIAELLDAPVRLCSVGPDRDQTIDLE